jgi:aspartyl-tRNA(Asn)/glutamyl-tRNA(Gln) amidotransferase subunit A
MDASKPYASLWETAGAVRTKQISPVELTRRYLERIQQIEPRVNCFITLTADAAMLEAHQAEMEINAGGYRGPLQGIPLAIKDLYETAGVATTHGSKIFAGHVPAEDGFVVKKLRQAGAVILGKLNMHEIALGVTNVNPHYGACRNPWDLERMTGGSSGGSAAALAAGLCLGSMGSDTGGSIRIPASLCGVVGLKPTRGRISLSGVLPLSWNMDHAGPMARRVRDVAILLQTVAGYDAADPYSVNVPVGSYLDGLEGGVHNWRIALANDEFFSQAEPEVLQAVQQAAAIFAELGAHVIPAPAPDGHAAARANVCMVTSDAAAYHQEWMQTRAADYGDDIYERLQGGADRTAAEYSHCRREQQRQIREYEHFFGEYDLLLTPTAPVTAPLIEGPNAVEQARLLTRFTAPFNLTRLPAISIPCGFTASGLPIGLQIVAPPWAEARLLQAAHAYEQAAGWGARTPDL